MADVMHIEGFSACILINRLIYEYVAYLSVSIDSMKQHFDRFFSTADRPAFTLHQRLIPFLSHQQPILYQILSMTTAASLKTWEALI